MKMKVGPVFVQVRLFFLEEYAGWAIFPAEEYYAALLVERVFSYHSGERILPCVAQGSV
jgi:hypothetical protein